MKKNFYKAAAILTAVATAAACSSDDVDLEEGTDLTYDNVSEEPQSETDNSDISEQERASFSVRMSMNKSDGMLKIQRGRKTETTPMGEENTWTIFVYMCGSDLESGGGMASMDIQEMLNADGSDNVRFVVETGGSSEWYIDDINSGEKQRFVIQNGDIELVGSADATNMGDNQTLVDFLNWGVENYSADKMGVVFWNHGGGSISGVCFDELSDNDSLSLRELDTALLNVSGNMTDRFEFIGFDACLMGTLETANVLATYANYMYGSQELEPGGGWDYTAIGSTLAYNPEYDGAQLGEALCDAYYSACDEGGDGDMATLAVTDLSKVDDLIISFNTFAQELYNATESSQDLSNIVRAIESADNFGGNNKTEGYTNMVDLGEIVSACGLDSSSDVISALEDAVVYKVSGSNHYKAGGLSVYYPLSFDGSQELSVFGDICVSPYYLAFIDKMSYGAANSGNVQDYSDEQLLGDGDEWDSSFSYDISDDGSYYYEDTSDDYWNYADDYSQTGESSLITFEQAPALDENGNYGFVLDENGIYNAAAVSTAVFTTQDNDLLELGETYDFNLDWETGEVSDGFNGYWLSLPDGQNLAMYVAEEGEDYVIYTSPVFVNGNETNLRIRHNFSDNSIGIEGTWDGIGENGVSAREIRKLADGDVIIPIYYSYGIEDDSESYYYGNEYTFSGDPEIIYDTLVPGDYYYAFCIDDIYGDYLITDYVMFTVDESGDIYFSEI